MTRPSTPSGCGIAGVLRIGAAMDGHPDVAAVRRMTDALAHRGPDHAGLLTAGSGVVLGHRRLAVTGLGPAGDQPMTRDHLTIVYNGEAYNAPQLRADLADHYRFTSTTDTEVVLRAWQHWGPQALDRLHGMYAFVIWDKRTQRAYLARDRLGIKPLYYHRGDDVLIFASEIEALLASGQVPRRPDLDTLTRQLLRSSTLQIDHTRTLVDNVHAVAPGTCLTLHRNGRIQTATYWTLPATPTPDDIPAHRDLPYELRDLLATSVTSMRMGDVPITAFLSGGLDSSTISAMAAEAGDLDCVTTCAADPDTPDDELQHARLVAERYPHRIRHHTTRMPAVLDLDDLDAVCDLAALSDDPRHPAILGNYRAVAKLDRRVVLNGQGADELLAGYITRPTFVQHLLDARAPTMATSRSLAASRQIPGLSDHILRQQPDVHAELRAFHTALPGSPLERAHRLLVHTQLTRILQFEDFLSMRVSVEARFPFLDHRIVEWAFTIPFHTHIDAKVGRGKQHLTAATYDLLPARVLTRPKAVFPYPDHAATQTALARLAVNHAHELRADPLIGHVFDVLTNLTNAPVGLLWPLLSLWRWHRKLAAAPIPAHT